MCGEGSASWETWEIKESRTGRVINSYIYIVHTKTVDCQESSVKQ